MFKPFDPENISLKEVLLSLPLDLEMEEQRRGAMVENEELTRGGARTQSQGV